MSFIIWHRYPALIPYPAYLRQELQGARWGQELQGAKVECKSAPDEGRICKEQALTFAEIKEVRQQKSVPILQSLGQWDGVISLRQMGGYKSAPDGARVIRLRHRGYNSAPDGTPAWAETKGTPPGAEKWKTCMGRNKIDKIKAVIKDDGFIWDLIKLTIYFYYSKSYYQRSF